MEFKEQVANEIHRPVRKNFPRRKVIVKAIDDLWQCDLIDMQKYSKFNDGNKYLLTVIDVFSKYAWALPVKNKTGKQITEAMSKLLKSKRIPKHIQSDLGTEFYNEDFKALMKIHSIKHYSTYSNLKASVVERFNRTLKNIMWKRFSVNGSYRWIDMLQNLLKKYNSTKHSTIKMKPNEVSKRVEKDLLRTVYNYYAPKKIDKKGISSKIKKEKEPKFEIGDHVRISKLKGVFDKGYTPNFSAEIFQVEKVVPTNPVTYKLKDINNKPIAGGFYEEELTKVKYSDVYLVEKVIKKKKGKIFVKWLGFPETENSWIDETNIL